MGKPAAKQGDKIKATDTHVVMVPAPPPKDPVPTSLPHTFDGPLSGELSPDVNIMGKRAAVVGSTASNPKHVPTPPGTSFQKPPSNTGTIQTGSQTVRINGKFAARDGDTAVTCNDPADAPVGSIVVTPGCTVNIG